MLAFLIVLFLSLVLLFVMLKDFDTISPKQKKIGIIILLAFGILIGVYTLLQKSGDAKIYDLQSAFNQNKKITCEHKDKQYDINKNDFFMRTQIPEFEGRKNGKYKGIIIEIKDCQIVDE